MTSTLTTEVTEENSTSNLTAENDEVMVTLRLPGKILKEMEKVMSLTGNPTRSSYIRRAILNELLRERRQQELEALEWEQRKESVRGSGSDDPFPKEQ